MLTSRQRVFLSFLLGISLTLGVVPRLSADIKTGRDAYELGDYEAALTHFIASARAGNAEAQMYLGMMYRGGQGVPINYSEAVNWYRRAAQQGHPKAQTNLAISYALGRGVEQDHQKAIQWYLRAARKGHVDAQLSLGQIYSSGDGIPVDYVQAYAWYTLGLQDKNTCDCILGYRDEVSEKMSAEDIRRAERLAEAWSARR